MTPWEAYGDAVLQAGTSGAGEHDLVAALGEPSMLSGLQRALALTDLELQVLALLCAVEVSVPRQRAVALLQQEDGISRLTLGTLAQLWPASQSAALTVAESGRLRCAALVDVEQDDRPWAAREVSASSSLVWALQGDSSPDPCLPPGTRVLPGARGPAASRLLHLLSGADRETRRRTAVEELGGPGVLVVPAPLDRREWDAVVREATLTGLAVLVEVVDRVPAGLDGVLRRADHLVWGLSSVDELPLTELPDVLRREVPVAAGVAGDDEWLDATGALPPAGARLDRRQLQLVALSTSAPADAVRRLAGGHLEKLATRVQPRRTWDDLVLPGPLTAQAHGLVARHRQRRLVYDEWGFPGLPSRGTVALMAGPSGTGKTLTAEVVAGELGLDLFVLDLSSVMSKYIGETEKNLGALFDAAQTGDVVLFFDEADALFGKRSAVSDAKDRYANVAVAYLLQRLERHDGLVLLATNLPNNIDEAFLRRLHATLEYPLPGPEQRRGIWARAFPPGCPTKDVDLDLLAAHVELSGGPIATAALAAAFAAAAVDEPVTLQRVVDAVSAEYRKQGRLALPAALLDACL